jgi:carbon-monoxide dehydrogenase large subunit
MSMMGQRVRRREDPRFLRGEGRFVDDVHFPGELHATFVRSYVAHGRIAELDVSAAREHPGVQVFTADDVELDKLAPPPFLPIDARFSRPYLAREVVRYAGDIVAVVLSEDRAAAVDAAELVVVDYDPLPVVREPRAALADDVVLFPEVGTNVVSRDPQPAEVNFDGCEVVVSGTVVSQRLAPSPLEPRASIARAGDDGQLEMWLSTQTPHQDRDALAGLLGLDPATVRVISPDVGGGFGAKMLSAEDIMLAWLSRHTGRPVRWTETRSESMVAMCHGRAQVIDYTIGGGRDGVVAAYHLSILQDAGAYPFIGTMLPQLTRLMASGVYRIPRVGAEVTVVTTNATPVSAFRGAGRPEATQAIERAMDRFAVEIGMDPAEVRRRNFIAADQFPFTTPTGAQYDCGDYAGALERVLDAAGYEQLRAEQARRREEGSDRQLGIGVSVYVEVTNGQAEAEFGAVEITPEGGAILRTGSNSHGQGHETSFAMIVADRLGLPVEAVRVVRGDTAEVPHGGGTYASKSVQVGGVAAATVSEEVVEQGRRLAADLLEASVEDVVHDRDAGRLHVAGSPQHGFSWAELAGRAQSDGRLEELRAAQDYQPSAATFPFGAHLAVVEVDVQTGGVTLERVVAVDDAGTIINPLLAEGQVHGGIATGVAQALFEEFSYDEEGNPQTGNFASYAFPSASELPSFELVSMQTPTPVNALGAKGIGESGTIGSTPAVHNAVIDALAPFGVRELQMPANGERVWQALADARATP